MCISNIVDKLASLSVDEQMQVLESLGELILDGSSTDATTETADDLESIADRLSTVQFRLRSRLVSLQRSALEGSPLTVLNALSWSEVQKLYRRLNPR